MSASPRVNPGRCASLLLSLIGRRGAARLSPLSRQNRAFVQLLVRSASYAFQTSGAPARKRLVKGRTLDQGPIAARPPDPHNPRSSPAFDEGEPRRIDATAPPTLGEV